MTDWRDWVPSLCCPATRTSLRLDEAAAELVSDEAGLAYPIRDGVPVLLVEEARHLGEPRPTVTGNEGEFRGGA